MQLSFTAETQLSFNPPTQFLINALPDLHSLQLTLSQIPVPTRPRILRASAVLNSRVCTLPLWFCALVLVFFCALKVSIWRSCKFATTCFPTLASPRCCAPAYPRTCTRSPTTPWPRSLKTSGSHASTWLQTHLFDFSIFVFWQFRAPTLPWYSESTFLCRHESNGGTCVELFQVYLYYVSVGVYVSIMQHCSENDTCPNKSQYMLSNLTP